MDAEKSLGESSSTTTSNHKSLPYNNNSKNNNNNDSTKNNNIINSNSRSPSFSLQSNNKQHASASMEDSSSYGDDVGWWDCSLCTYKNSAERFKCEICDLRRGTSTRKPRCNADTIVAQVVKQQEQIRQQTRVKPTKSRSNASSSNNNNAATSSNDYSLKSKPKITSKTPDKKASRADTDPTDDGSDSESVDLPKPKRKRSSEAKSKQRGDSKTTSTATNTNRDSDSCTEYETTDVSESESPHPIRRSASETSLESNLSHYSSSSPEPTTSSPYSSSKNLDNPPIELNGNLIKYSPPTSSGRTGLIIDKKRFTQHSVTVNEVTITFTEFATRQNKYIRKKKKIRRDTSKSKSNNTNGKSRNLTKAESRPSPNDASSTAARDT